MNATGADHNNLVYPAAGASRVRLAQRRHFWKREREAHPVRLLCALAATLALVLLVVHWPGFREESVLKWRFGAPEERVSAMLFNEALQTLHESPALALETFGLQDAEEGKDEEDEKAGEEEQIELPPEQEPDIQPVKPVPVEITPPPLTATIARVPDQLSLMPGNLAMIEDVETPPDGESAIRINYPASAQFAGVQGRVLLAFVIEEDGRTSDIHVLQTLHPACDSAAVRAVRKARFVPALQDGRPVRVWVQLPVRYLLVGS